MLPYPAELEVYIWIWVIVIRTTNVNNDPLFIYPLEHEAIHKFDKKILTMKW